MPRTGVLKVLRERHLALELFGADLAFRLVVRVGLAETVDPPGFVGGTAVQLVFEVFGTEDGEFDEEKFTSNSTGFGVVEDGPYGDLCERTSCHGTC